MGVEYLRLKLLSAEAPKRDNDLYDLPGLWHDLFDCCFAMDEHMKGEGKYDENSCTGRGL
jgi:hypothetical protein